MAEQARSQTGKAVIVACITVFLFAVLATTFARTVVLVTLLLPWLVVTAWALQKRPKEEKILTAGTLVAIVVLVITAR